VSGEHETAKGLRALFDDLEPHEAPGLRALVDQLESNDVQYEEQVRANHAQARPLICHAYDAPRRAADLVVLHAQRWQRAETTADAQACLGELLMALGHLDDANFAAMLEAGELSR